MSEKTDSIEDELKQLYEELGKFLGAEVSPDEVVFHLKDAVTRLKNIARAGAELQDEAKKLWFDIKDKDAVAAFTLAAVIGAGFFTHFKSEPEADK